MPELLEGGQIKLDSGEVRATKEGEWYDGFHFLKGSLASQKGFIHSEADVPGAGERVSEEVDRASAKLQGKDYPEFKAFLEGPNANSVNRTSTPTSGGGSSIGAGSVGSTSGGSTSFNVKEEYDKLYGDLGIDALKSDVEAKQAEITARRDRLADAQAIINENPFYAEATRVGKARRLDEQAQDDIENIAREQALLQAKVDEANQQLAVKSTLGTQQYEIDRQAKADSVGELNALLQSGADLGNINIAEFSAATGMSEGTIQALVAATESQEIKPSVIQSTDNAGNVTVTIIDQNTGAIVGQQSLGAVGKITKVGGDSKATEAEIGRYYTESLRADVSSGLGVRQVFQLYSGYIDPNQIIQLYNANSPHGPAKESSDELAALGVTSYYGKE